MRSRLEKLLIGVLGIGVGFSWVTVFSDFQRFYDIYGTIFRIQNCLVPNPVVTPCFYGAIAFFVSFILLLARKYIYLKYLLIGGTLFAWGNFSYEAYKFYMPSNIEKIGCSGVVVTNLFATPCFYGAVIYLLSLIIFLKFRGNSK
jgi:hypothetical protein